MKPHATLIDFTAQAMEDGFDEIIQKEWACDLVLEKHTHPFDARVQLSAGQLVLSLASGVQKFESGQGFFLARGVEHAEQYGPQGATLWVARKL